MQLRMLLVTLLALTICTPATATATLQEEGAVTGSLVTEVSGGPYLVFMYSGGELTNFHAFPMFMIDIYEHYPYTGSYYVADGFEGPARLTAIENGFSVYAGDSFYHPCTVEGYCIEESLFEGLWLVEANFSSTTHYAILTSGVPEPATWAMMLAGFGAIGFGMRRRRRDGAQYLRNTA